MYFVIFPQESKSRVDTRQVQIIFSICNLSKQNLSVIQSIFLIQNNPSIIKYIGLFLIVHLNYNLMKSITVNRMKNTKISDQCYKIITFRTIIQTQIKQYKHVIYVFQCLNYDRKQLWPSRNTQTQQLQQQIKMKKVYICSNCNQYHPQGNKHHQSRIKNSKHPLRFSDLSVDCDSHVGQRIEKSMKKSEINVKNDSMIPRAHPQNMTISAIKYKYNWNKKSHQHKQSHNLTELIDARTTEKTKTHIKNFNQTSHSKIRQKTACETPGKQGKSPLNGRYNKQTINTSESQQSFLKTIHKQQYFKSSPHHNQMKMNLSKKQIKHFTVYSSIKRERTNNKMKEDVESQDDGIMQVQNPGGVFFLESQLVVSQLPFQNKKIQTPISASVQKKLNYFQEMNKLRKILGSNQKISRRSIEQLSNLKTQNYCKIKNLHDHQNQQCTFKDNRCLGFNLCCEEGEIQLTHFPKLYI